MLMVELADRRRIAIRPSGTEPKIKYYMFAAHLPPAGKTFTPAEVAAARQSVGASLASLWDWLGKDASARLG
jgi:phosphoglucomutase